MDAQPDVVGYVITRLMYQGNGIFTLFLKKDKHTLGLNFIDCILLNDNGCVGNTIAKIDISDSGIMGIVHLHACDRQNLNRNSYRSVYLETKDESTGLIASKKELYLATSKVDLSEDLGKYNMA